jgi:hypothetical protein
MAEINLKKTILEYRKPSLILDELAVVDTGSQEGNRNQTDFKSNNIQSKFFGRGEPLIRINSFKVAGLINFELDLNSFKPHMSFRFKTIDDSFIFTSFPKDGDIASLYISPLGEMFKPIRMDFIITEVDSSFSKAIEANDTTDSVSSTGRYITFNIYAEARIPKLYKQISKSFNGNSSEAILKIAEDLDLGFSTNELDTSDSMNWICPNQDYMTWIKEITNSAWKGENDYFDCWIDQYYNINFVNVRKQFDNNNEELETIRVPYGADRDADLMPGADTFEMEFPVLLTNSTTHAQSPLFIKSLSIENNAGRINNDLGYFQKVQFYDSNLNSDKPLNKYVGYNIESITNKEISGRSVINKGRLGEDIYKEEEKRTYVGTMYFENVHENFQQASIQNILNRNDNYKILLKIKTRYWTPFLYRGQSIPVTIFNNGSVTSAGDSKNSVDGGQEAALNPPPDKKNPNIFLSGQYVVLGITVTYSKKYGMGQKLLLGKKEWIMNPGIASESQASIQGNTNYDPGYDDFSNINPNNLKGNIFDK